MVVDTSAIVAIALGEPEQDALLLAMTQASHVTLSAVTLFESSIVLMSRTGVRDPEILDDVLREFRVRVSPVDEIAAFEALEAFRRFGKGRHPAGLNFGDCFSYALAMRLGEPLLFKGNDFSQTDVLVASY